MITATFTFLIVVATYFIIIGMQDTFIAIKNHFSRKGQKNNGDNSKGYNPRMTDQHVMLMRKAA